jgi:hypothetical protein
VAVVVLLNPREGSGKERVNNRSQRAEQYFIITTKRTPNTGTKEKEGEHCRRVQGFASTFLMQERFKKQKLLGSFTACKIASTFDSKMSIIMRKK